MTIIAELSLGELVEDLEREDDARGPEPEAGADAAVFYRLVFPLVLPLAEGSRPCGACGGSGGYPETTYDADGTQRTTWHSCGACGGSGQS